MTFTPSRRDVIGVALTGAAAPSLAQRPMNAPSAEHPVEVAALPEPAGLLSREVVELWPTGHIPGGQGVLARRIVLERGATGHHDRAVTHVGRPLMEVFRPESPNGAAMLVLPGGGYVRLAVDKEGAGGARFLAGRGVTAFVLNYRLPGDGWAAGYDAPLQDVQRAIRVVRARAQEWRLDPARVGVMGFSAGGHLAAAALTRYDETTYAAIDAIDARSARPDMAVLGYAVMQIGHLPVAGVRSNLDAQRSLEERIRPGLAPTFVFQAADDRTVPVANSLAMYAALVRAGVQAELHLYQEGGHGFGFALGSGYPASRWPDAWAAWAARVGFLKGSDLPDKRVSAASKFRSAPS